MEIGRRSDDGGIIRVTSTDDVSGELTVIVRRDLTPREVVALPEPEVDTIIAGEWLSPRSRELLEDIGYGYVDQTGNVSAVVKRPRIVFRIAAHRDCGSHQYRCRHFLSGRNSMPATAFFVWTSSCVDGGVFCLLGDPAAAVPRRDKKWRRWPPSRRAQKYG